ncbi:MAG: hypothetical protein JOY78_20370 [Pseudonocardia sp.]|nr:hypothetical protein [Pseudonocardia sp.]
MTIEAPQYGKTRERLMRDPIVVRMAADLLTTPLKDLTHSDGHPRFSFMLSASKTFAARGGTGATHVGAVAEAVLHLVKMAHADAAKNSVEEVEPRHGQTTSEQL